jgi:hypothetical protein
MRLDQRQARLRAIALAGALVGWSFTAGLDQPWRRHPVAQAAYGTALAAVARAPLGLRPPALRSGLRAGLAVAEAFGARGGRLLQALTFGLTHIPDARGTGEPVLGTIAVTGLAGWVFGLLADRSGSLAAPMLAHLAINEAGAIAALAAQRRARSPLSPAGRLR